MGRRGVKKSARKRAHLKQSGPERKLDNRVASRASAQPTPETVPIPVPSDQPSTSRSDATTTSLSSPVVADSKPGDFRRRVGLRHFFTAAAVFVFVTCVVATSYLFYVRTQERVVPARFHAHPTELHLLIWRDYVDPALIAAFEKEMEKQGTRCIVRITTYKNNQELGEYLDDRRQKVDVFVPSSYYLKALARRGHIEPVNRSWATSLQYLPTNFLANFQLEDVSEYGLPYLIAPTGLGVKIAVSPPPESSWLSLSRSSTRTFLLEDMREALAVGLLVNKKDPSSEVPKDLNEANSTLKSWIERGSVQIGDGSANAETVQSGDTQIAHVYAGDLAQVSGDHPAVRFMYPREGYTVTCDFLCVSSRSLQRDLARQFVNFLSRPENAQKNMGWTMYRSPFAKPADDFKAPPGFITDLNSRGAGYILKPLSDKAQTEYERTWGQLVELEKTVRARQLVSPSNLPSASVPPIPTTQNIQEAENGRR